MILLQLACLDETFMCFALGFFKRERNKTLQTRSLFLKHPQRAERDLSSFQHDEGFETTNIEFPNLF